MCVISQYVCVDGGTSVHLFLYSALSFGVDGWMNGWINRQTDNGLMDGDTL